VADFCESGNEHSGSVKGWIVLDYLSDCQLLEKDSVPWSLFMVSAQ
jgi:hypothetical protein